MMWPIKLNGGVVMAKKVEGEQYYKVDGQLLEIKRQLRQRNGYPFDIDGLLRHLQAGVEGRFIGMSNIIKIDRSEPFEIDTDEFFGQEGWTIKNLDERSLALKEIDLSCIHFEPIINTDPDSEEFNEQIESLKKEGFIHLDARVFFTLLKNQYLIPEEWKKRKNEWRDVIPIYFAGSSLVAPKEPGDKSSENDPGIMPGLRCDDVNCDWSMDWEFCECAGVFATIKA